MPIPAGVIRIPVERVIRDQTVSEWVLGLDLKQDPEGEDYNTEQLFCGFHRMMLFNAFPDCFANQSNFGLFVKGRTSPIPFSYEAPL